MLQLRPVALVSALCLLSACAGIAQDGATNSGFATLDAQGGFNRGLSDSYNNGLIDRDGEGFAFEVGVEEGDGFAGVAGLLPGTDTQFWPGVGTATYRGSYLIGYIDDIDLSGNLIFGNIQEARGNIDLTANFVGNTLSGRSPDGVLAINGEMNGRIMTGSATFDPFGSTGALTGPLQGRAGGDQAFGAFHGNNADLIFAGGFIADRN